MKAKIIGTGSCVPKKVVTNDDLAKIVDTSDAWIRERTGIEERRVTDENTSTSDLALEAGKRALIAAKIDSKQIDLIIGATCTPDVFFPSVACILQNKLGAVNAAAFDLSAACSGFNYSLATAASFIESGAYKTILVVGADTLTKYVDWTDRNTCVLFGDGAGAVVLQATNEDCGVMGSYLKSKGESGNLDSFLFLSRGGSFDPESKKGWHFIRMEGKEVFKFAVKALEESLLEITKLGGIKFDDVDLFIPHQANIRIIDHVIKKFNLPKEKVYVNLQKYGNTSAASIPIALDEAVAQNRIKKGDIIVLSGFGAGLTYGANLVKWG